MGDNNDGIPGYVADDELLTFIEDSLQKYAGELTSFSFECEVHDEFTLDKQTDAYDITIALLVIPADNRVFAIEQTEYADSPDTDISVAPVSYYYKRKAETNGWEDMTVSDTTIEEVQSLVTGEE